MIALLKRNFGNRLLYVGLQGSYLRNEADDNSDIDIMVVLDEMSIQDLELYKESINEVGNGDKACGFVCGKTELAGWNPCEICHLVHTTKDYHGRLADFVPAYTTADETNFIKISLDNLYHEICHRYIHASREKNVKSLPDAYKSVFFILQNIYFQRTGVFVQTKRELLALLSGEDKNVLHKSLELKNSYIYDFDEAFQILFEWCRNSISRI